MKTRIQQHGSTYSAHRRTPQPLRLWDSKYNYQNIGYVAYQILGDHECSNMVANILPAVPLPQSFNTQIPTLPSLTLGLGSKGKNSTFSEHVHIAYQIKENGT